jgi:hypothetical protein
MVMEQPDESPAAVTAPPPLVEVESADEGSDARKRPGPAGEARGDGEHPSPKRARVEAERGWEFEGIVEDDDDDDEGFSQFV